MASLLLQAVIAHFDSVYEGPNGDYPAVLEALAGVNAAQAAWKPAPDCNSIWQITDHLTASKMWQIEMLEKGQADFPVWSEAAGGEDEWQESLAELHSAHARLKSALSQMSEESLFTIPDPAWNHNLLELLLSSAAHDAHHSGQLDYLKGLQKKMK